MHNNRHTIKIVVVGGGFGGIYTIKNLLKNQNQFKDNIEITLINKHNYFLFSPMLHEVATGGLDSTNIIEPIREFFQHNNVNLILGEVQTVDLNSKKVCLQDQNIDFDYFVLATGSKTNFYNNNTLVNNPNVYELKNLEHAHKIREKVISSFEKANNTIDDTLKQKLLTFVIVGAGATGVELSAELSELIYHDLVNVYTNINKKDIKIILISGDNQILSGYSAKSQRFAKNYLTKLGVEIFTNCFVTDVNLSCLNLNSTDTLKSNNIFWVAGVTPQYPKIIGKVEFSKLNRLIVSNNLNLPNYNFAFAVGDIVDGWPMSAYAATRQSVIVAQNIINTLNDKKLLEFNFEPKVKLVSLGQKNAILEVGNVNLHGRIIWFIWRTIYLSKIMSFRRKVKIALNWTFNLFSKRDTSVY